MCTGGRRHTVAQRSGAGLITTTTKVQTPVLAWEGGETMGGVRIGVAGAGVWWHKNSGVKNCSKQLDRLRKKRCWCGETQFVIRNQWCDYNTMCVMWIRYNAWLQYNVCDVNKIQCMQNQYFNECVRIENVWVNWPNQAKWCVWKLCIANQLMQITIFA